MLNHFSWANDARQFIQSELVNPYDRCVHLRIVTCITLIYYSIQCRTVVLAAHRASVCVSVCIHSFENDTQYCFQSEN